MKRIPTLQLAFGLTATVLLTGCYGAVQDQPIRQHEPTSRIQDTNPGVTLDAYFRAPNQNASAQQPGDVIRVQA
ncbi:MAG: hypothetical protein AAF288_02620 [Planctomycetota bacterium]